MGFASLDTSRVPCDPQPGDFLLAKVDRWHPAPGSIRVKLRLHVPRMTVGAPFVLVAYGPCVAQPDLRLPTPTSRCFPIRSGAVSTSGILTGAGLRRAIGRG